MLRYKPPSTEQLSQVVSLENRFIRWLLVSPNAVHAHTQEFLFRCQLDQSQSLLNWAAKCCHSFWHPQSFLLFFTSSTFIAIILFCIQVNKCYSYIKTEFKLKWKTSLRLRSKVYWPWPDHVRKGQVQTWNWSVIARKSLIRDLSNFFFPSYLIPNINSLLSPRHQMQ